MSCLPVRGGSGMGVGVWSAVTPGGHADPTGQQRLSPCQAKNKESKSELGQPATEGGEENNVNCDQTGNVLEAARAWSVSSPKLSEVFENCHCQCQKEEEKGKRKND
ncbi:LOW QUALITY PROTEIN: hypothetical protein IFM47457_02639 [Aspergillus lentulus]|nr:LOW QUALITY PROTEIN: hypothetical protein IFM47457_02639 [Aspergillus lentulus]